MREAQRTRDEWLAIRCQLHVPGAFEDLTADLERPLFYYASKLTGNQDESLDILQEVWLRALPGLRKLRDPSAVRAWLYSIAHAVTVDRVRSRRARQRDEKTHIELSDIDINFHTA